MLRLCDATKLQPLGRNVMKANEIRSMILRGFYNGSANWFSRVDFSLVSLKLVDTCRTREPSYHKIATKFLRFASRLNGDLTAYSYLAPYLHNSRYIYRVCISQAVELNVRLRLMDYRNVLQLCMLGNHFSTHADRPFPKKKKRKKLPTVLILRSGTLLSSVRLLARSM